MLDFLLGLLEKLLSPLLKRYLGNRALDLEHDRAVFRKADEALSEAFLDRLLNGNLYHRWCWLDDIRMVRHFCEDFSQIGNQFLDAKVQEAATNVVTKLGAVDSFVATHFFVTGIEDGQRLQLYPELRDTNPDFFERHVRELNARTEEAWKAYRTFRALVKKRLKV